MEQINDDDDRQENITRSRDQRPMGRGRPLPSFESTTENKQLKFKTGTD